MRCTITVSLAAGAVLLTPIRQCTWHPGDMSFDEQNLASWVSHQRDLNARKQAGTLTPEELRAMERAEARGREALKDLS